ncbi:MAG TPA: phage tail protein [Pyrinomonadaceae bacterium]|jgi:phage tail-like protein|nr:phage tail protein [Pyrinomonadaceae bacterium]
MRSPDPYKAFRFAVEINNTRVGGFSEVTGLEVRTEVDEHREGGVNDYVHKIAKETRYPNVTLKRGITDKTDLWDWHQQVVLGDVERKTVSVVVLDVTGREKWRLVFHEAYPVKWNGTDLNATGNTVFVESIELAHHGMTKQ